MLKDSKDLSLHHLFSRQQLLSDASTVFQEEEADKLRKKQVTSIVAWPLIGCFQKKWGVSRKSELIAISLGIPTANQSNGSDEEDDVCFVHDNISTFDKTNFSIRLT